MNSLQNEHGKKLARTEKEIYYPHLYLEELVMAEAMRLKNMMSTSSSMASPAYQIP
jgi:hypothetical protein